MARQLEKGTQNPLRPTTVALITQAAFTFPVDATPPVDWTQNTSRIPLAILTQVMDDPTPKRVTVSSNFLNLEPGIYRLEFYAVVLNAAVAIKNMKVAFTNAAGSTVHRESPDMAVAASSTGTPVYFEAVLHQNASAKVEVQVRAVQTTATAGLSLAISTPCLTVTRIGNVNEA